MVHNQSGQSSRTIVLKQQVLMLIDKAILGINNEINKHKCGMVANGTIAQLENIRQEVEKMKTTLNSKIFLPFYPVIIVDSWDFKSILGNDLLTLAEKYKKL
jgi:hypothetical protein